MSEWLYQSGLLAADAVWWQTLAWPVIWIFLKIVGVVLPLLLCVAYLTLWERKAIGFPKSALALTAWDRSVCFNPLPMLSRYSPKKSSNPHKPARDCSSWAP